MKDHIPFHSHFTSFALLTVFTISNAIFYTVKDIMKDVRKFFKLY